MLIIRILLLPLGLLYGLIMEMRNRFYDWGIFKSLKFSVPVISVGNLTLGGSGKTPFTIFLAEALKEEYPGIAVVSRGYGRKSKGLQLVSDGKDILLGPEMAGDEPWLIAHRLPWVICAVSEKRAEAIYFLQEKYDIDLVILDDAFQHRGVRRNVDILLINSKQPFRFNFPLPAGTLREFKHNYKRAHVVVVTNSESAENPIPQISLPVFQSHVELNDLRDIHFKSAGNLKKLKGHNVIAFAGIANPQIFWKGLEKNGVKVKYFKAFPDHHSYSHENMRRLFIHCAKLDCSRILCTEKDLVKIRALSELTDMIEDYGIKLLAVTLNIIIQEQQKLIKNIKTILTNQN